GLLNFVAQDRSLFEILILDGFVEFFLKGLQPVGKIAALPQRFGDFADMTGALVHGLEQTLERFGKNFVTFGATEAASLFDIGLGEAATRALDFDAAAGLLDFL